MPPNDPEERKPSGEAERPIDVTTETLVADRSLGAVPVGWDADMAVTALYSAHYRSLVRLAVLLVRDVRPRKRSFRTRSSPFTAPGAG